MTLFMVVWSGGYEAPSYALKPTKKEAFALAETWAEDADLENGDWIDVLRLTDLDTQMPTVERMVAA